MLDPPSVSILKPAAEAVTALWRWLRGRRGGLKPEEIVALRKKWRPVIDERLALAKRDRLGRDVTVKDVRRLDQYPNFDGDTKSISPCFRAGLVGTYDGGIQLLLGWHELSNEVLDFLGLDGIQKLNADEGGNAALIGYVPFEQIVDVDWNCDDYNSRPSLYLHFDAAREGPYERIALCRQKRDHGVEWYSEICDVDAYRDGCSKLGIKPYWLNSMLE